MIGSILRKATLGAIVGAAALAVSVPEANAWWHGSSGGSSGGSWGSSGGSSGGSWGSSGGSSGGSWGSSGGSWGSSGGMMGGMMRGMMNRMRARRAWGHYSYYSSGGSYGSHGSSGGSWGSSGGSHGSHGSNGGSHGSWGSQGGTAVESYRQDQPMPPSEGQEGDEPSDDPPLPPSAVDMPDDSVRYAPNQGSALVGVRVPAGTKVFVNGRETRSTGVRRWYVSRGLQQGKAYAYEVRAELMRGDQKLVETKQVRIRGGQRVDLEFRFEEAQTAARPSEDSPRTTLILHVPDDAKVTLAGRETKARGPVREFSTMKLVAVGQWANYPVRVEIELDGETMVQQRTITLTAGQTVEETFDFDAPKIAQSLANAGR